MNGIVERMIRASRLDPALYEEVEADPSTMGQAVAVVIISSVAAGLGSALAGGFAGLLGGTLMALLGWFLWSLVVYLIGTRALPEPQTEADYGQLLRTIGFSSAPGVLMLFAFIPYLGWVIGLGVRIWMLVAMVVAIRQALDYRSTGRAVVVALLGWLAYLLLAVVLGGLFWMGGVR